MEPGKDLPNAIPNGEAPVLISPSLPTNFMHFPSSALFPVGSASAFGNILSVPLLSHTLLPALQQKPQLSLQSEPLLLFPASTLSFAASSSAVVSAPLLSPETLPPTVLHSQHLHLNNAQMPLVLKPSDSLIQMDQTWKTQLIGQQFILVPVSGENPVPAFEKNSSLKAISEIKNSPGNENQSGSRKNSPVSRQDISHSQKDKNSSTKIKITTRSTKKKNALTNKSTVQEENLAHSSAGGSVFSTSTSDLNKLGVADVISSIPSGWEVVGVAGLNQLILEDLLSTSRLSPSLTSLLTAKPKASNAEATTEVKNENSLLTEEIRHNLHDQPSLVSVNLNTASQPVASETVIDRWPTNELTCSVKMDDIPCTNMISIKTEYVENGENNSGSGLIESDHDSKDSATLTKEPESHINLCSSVAVTNRSSQESHSSGIESGKAFENDHPSEETPQIKSSDCGSNNIQSPFADSKWTIIGLTSLPSQPTTNTVTVSQTDSADFEQISENKHYSAASTDLFSTTNTTILKIPLCSTSILSSKQEKSTSSVGKSSLHEDSGSSPLSLVVTDGSTSSNDADLSSSSKSEDIKWTIVGVVGSSLMDSCSLNPSVSSASELLGNSCPTISPSVPSARQETMMKSQLLKMLSSSSSSCISPPLTSSKGQLHSEICGKRKSKLQEKTKKSPKTRSSVNGDDAKLVHTSPPPQSQWKVVGITQLGIPPSPASAVVPLPQLNPASPVLSVPFLVSAESSSLLSNTTTGTTSIITQTTGTTSSSNLLSQLSTASTLLSTPTMPFPVFGLDRISCNTPITLSPPSPFLTPASPPSVQVLQDIAQQQNLSQFIKNQLTACQSPVSSLTQNDNSQWNVVGVVANNHVSLLSPVHGSPQVINTVATISKPSSQDTTQHILPVPSAQNIKSKQNISSYDGKKIIKPGTANKSGTIRQSLASRFDDQDSKHYNLKCKGQVNRHQQESPKIKKNTVSNLLRMKRMQQRTSENVCSEVKEQIYEELQDFSEASCPVPQKKPKTRSLRSYAGNRKIFTRMQSKTFNENLKSGTQIPAVCCESEDGEDQEIQTSTTSVSSRKIDGRATDMSEIVEDINVNVGSSMANVEAQSSSRRRKLKVPRKMVADLDYHPFDSSSDSN